MNNPDLAKKIAQRLLLEYTLRHIESTPREMDSVSEEELAAVIEDEIEANGD